MLKKYKYLLFFVLTVALVCTMSVGTFAAGTGDVAGAIEGTWNDASVQIKTVVNKVVFPAIDLILAVFFFAKVGTAYFDTGNMASSSGAVLLFCLPVLCSRLPLRFIFGRYSHKDSEMRANPA